MELGTQIVEAWRNGARAGLPQDGAVGVPEFDRSRCDVGIVHLGVGGFVRAHLALYTQRLLEKQFREACSAAVQLQWGICGVGVLPTDRDLVQRLQSQDNLYSILEKGGAAGGEAVRLRIVGSILETLLLCEEQDRKRVFERMVSPKTHIVSLTITEKGYMLDGARQLLHVEQDPERPVTAIGVIVLALEMRRRKNIKPFTVLSCDNIPCNGTFVRSAVMQMGARSFGAEFSEYVAQLGRFPSSMVDGITPIAYPADRDIILERFRIADKCPTVCESWRQFVIQDAFVDGERPEWDLLQEQPVEWVSSEAEIMRFENIKISLLNVPHSALSYAGRLLGLTYIHEAMGNPYIHKYIRDLMDIEITPYLTFKNKPLPLDLEEYKATLRQRFANPHTRDSLERVSQDGSTKYANQLIPIVRTYATKGTESPPIKRLACAVAAWAVSLLGKDETGRTFEVFDGRLDTLRSVLEASGIEGLCDDASLFGTNAHDLADFRRHVVAIYSSLLSVGVERTLSSLDSA
ncbi:Mannitol 2-dehydrogenase [Porphyridium purpureum]|uniref:mannitol 2-dehydrogenase n=1 Tax=Porphyridium purpureum TaxID=35688 RepID=A0A5J4Z5W9_PORPP|nr:Mannitol 2-dehydrogenase [Porphyridium purpureum]|eukprot:POR0476..scf295_1